MERRTTIPRSTLGALMILGGIMHFLKPELYGPFIPDALPKNLVTYLSGAVEILLGAGLFLPRLRTLASLGVLMLMIAFLPLHLADVFRDAPAIGSKLLAYIRLPLQFVLIGWAWLAYKGALSNAAGSASER